MSEKLQNEVDANFEAFQRILPELLRRDADRWALMSLYGHSVTTKTMKTDAEASPADSLFRTRHGECVACYDTVRDAHTAGRTQYEDGLFSAQLISAGIVDLGWFSHAGRFTFSV